MRKLRQVVLFVATQEEVQSFSIPGRDRFVNSIGTLLATSSESDGVTLWAVADED